MPQLAPNARLVHAAKLLDESRPDQAKLVLAQVLAKSPADPDALRMMRHALTRLGEAQAALYYAEKARALRPDDPDALNLYANSLVDLGRLEEAEQALRRALELKPEHALNTAALANVLSLEGRLVEALELCEKGLVQHGDMVGLSGVLTNVLVHLGETERAVDILKQQLAQDPTNLGRLSLLCVALNYLPSVTPAELYAAHCAYGRQLESQAPVPHPKHSNERDPERALNVGFVSGDLRAHAVAFFAEPVLEGLDRERFRVHAYQTMAEDAISERIKKIPGLRWANVSRLSPFKLAERIRADRIDVLIDLAGHTVGNALPAFHLRPAPVQASWLGYLCTTGVPAIKWKIIDADGEPADAQKYATETLRRMAPAACVYRPARDLPEVGLSPSVENGYVTFGSFSSSSKLNDAVLARWARTVNTLRTSRLLLKNPAFKDVKLRERTVERLARLGLSRDRVQIASPTPDVRSHLATYNKVDVALDTHPWPGITTACDAIVMGVPLVSRIGETSVSRGCVPILNAAGLGDCVVRSDEEFVATAVRYAQDAKMRDGLRRELRARFLASPLCDERGFGAKFGDELRGMWREHCAHE